MGIQPSKKLGQNFLVNEIVCCKIVDECIDDNISNIIEIGPGLGALTRDLINIDKPFSVIELDNKLAKYWQERGVEVEHIDALKFPWQEKIKEKTLVVSNLPYQISSSIVVELSLVPHVSKMVFMFQKEVAQRIKANKGGKDYGLLSIIAQSYWQITKLVDVPPRAFYPPPKIDSRVLVFQRLENTEFCNKDFINFVKLAFSHRRKLLSKNLKEYRDEMVVKNAFNRLGLNEKIRAEQLSVDEFQRLYLELKNEH